MESSWQVVDVLLVCRHDGPPLDLKLVELVMAQVRSTGLVLSCSLMVSALLVHDRDQMRLFDD